MNRNTTVVVVDDDEDDLFFLAELAFAAGGNPVIICGSFAEGLEALQEENPALLITDYNLGPASGTGVDLIDLIRELSAERGPFPVILVSGGTIYHAPLLERTHPGLTVLHKKDPKLLEAIRAKLAGEEEQK